MICLTGDLHHQSLCTGNQAHADKTELAIAREYLALLEEAQVKTTFFISAKCFLEQPEEVVPICEHPLVEVGGHNYSCFQPEIFHRICKKLLGSYNGPYRYQLWDARRTKEIIKQATGIEIRSWRNHQYMHGPYTEKVLSECGLELCSDGVEAACIGPRRDPDTGLLNFPLNVIPDHEHLYHAERTPEWVEWWQRRYNWNDDFGQESYYIEEWTEIVLDCLQKNEARGAISNMIIHPITMYLCDGFKGFLRILDYLSRRETVHLSRVMDQD